MAPLSDARVTVIDFRPIPWRLLLYAWASPNSLVGLSLFLLCRWVGAECRAHSGVLEVSGPGVERLLSALPVRIRVLAITFGHVVLGRDRHSLEKTRLHERVHVEQYQRWGPAFLPAYALASLVAWLRGGDPYLDNAFERAAYAAERASDPSA